MDLFGTFFISVTYTLVIPDSTTGTCETGTVLEEIRDCDKSSYYIGRNIITEDGLAIITALSLHNK